MEGEEKCAPRWPRAQPASSRPLSATGRLVESTQAEDRRLISLVAARPLLYARTTLPVASYYSQVKKLWQEVADLMTWIGRYALALTYSDTYTFDCTRMPRTRYAYTTNIIFIYK